MPDEVKEKLLSIFMNSNMSISKLACVKRRAELQLRLDSIDCDPGFVQMNTWWNNKMEGAPTYSRMSQKERDDYMFIVDKHWQDYLYSSSDMDIMMAELMISGKYTPKLKKDCPTQTHKVK
jgi:hypothetical protein